MSDETKLLPCPFCGALGARQEMQRERNIEAFLSNRRSWWQGILDRGDENYPQDPMDDI